MATTKVSRKTEARNSVEAASLKYEWMAERNSWDLLEVLRAGSARIRKEREKWLPREEKEKLKSYNSRLKRSFLFEAYDDTVSRIASEPFRKPVTYHNIEKLDPRLQALVDNADGQGTHLDDFLMSLLDDGIDRGLTHVVVDVPKLAASSLQEERRLAKPYFVHVRAKNLKGWREGRDDQGELTLSQARVHETEVEEVGEFGEKEVRRIRVWEAPDPGAEEARGTWSLWEDEGGNKFKRVEDPTTHSYPGIPIATYYTARQDHRVADAPLRRVADLNLAHYQSLSDQRNILKFSRIPMIHLSGCTTEDMDREVVIAAGAITKSVNSQSKMTFVEHSGEAIAAGRTDLKDIEAQMQVFGMAPFIERSGDETATGKSIDEAKNQSKAQSWVRALERFARSLFEIAAKWIGVEVPEDFRIDIFNEFSLSLRADKDVQILLQACVAGKITAQTFLMELQRRGILAPDLDVTEEAEKATAENVLPAEEEGFGDDTDEDDTDDGSTE